MRLPPSSALLLAALPLLALPACGPDAEAVGETTDNLVGSDGDNAVDTAEDSAAETPPAGPATTRISGRVRVELYSIDAAGVQRPVTFEEAWGGTFPYGMIFVGAYIDREGDGIATDWHATANIVHPSVDGDSYSFDVTLPDGVGDVYLYAQLDQRGDGILASTDPSGVRSEPVHVTHGGVATDADIVIMVNVTPGGGSGGGGSGGGDWGGEWGGGGGSGGSGDTDTGAGGSDTGAGGGGTTDCSSISGTAQIPDGWDDGEAVVTMLYDATGYGPYKVGMVRDMAATPGGAAEGSWSMSICEDYGGVRLLGAWDSNANGLIDPSDIWGGYAWASGMDGNPILVNRRTTLTGLNVLIPFNGGRARDQGVTVSPLVRVEGDVSMTNGAFASLPPGTQVHVVASRFLPGVDVAVTGFADGYDHQSFVWSEIDGQAALPYALVVPSNTTMYVWAYADTDGDGLVNEPGEPMATAGARAGGEVRTGSSTSSYDLHLIVPG